jgi:hypothetical protein
MFLVVLLLFSMMSAHLVWSWASEHVGCHGPSVVDCLTIQRAVYRESLVPRTGCHQGNCEASTDPTPIFTLSKGDALQ